MVYVWLCDAWGTIRSSGALPTDIGYTERLIRAIKAEEVDRPEYEDYHDDFQQIGRFLNDVYMHKEYS